MKPWEFHPILVHFPIAFLLAGVVLDLVALRRPGETLTRSAGGLLLAGMISGWLAVLAGLLAFFTVQAHTEEAHGLMYWHLGIGLTCLLLFTWISVRRWRQRETVAKKAESIVSVLAAVLLIVTGDLGGGLVYHGGAGVDPALLAREIREGHSHAGSSSEHGTDKENVEHGHESELHGD